MYLDRANKGALNESQDFAGKVSPDLFGAIDMIVESERAWHNLEMKMIKAEHTAIVTEDAALMEGAIGDFYAKAKAWFVSMYNKIKEFISRLIERIGVFFMGAKKFVSKYGAQLEKLAANEMKGEVEINEGLKEGDKLVDASPASDLIRGLEKEMDNDALLKATGIKSAEEVRTELLGDKATVKLDPSLVKASLGILRAEAKLRTSIDKAKAAFEKACNAAIKECDKGKEGADENAKKEINIVISNYRKAISAANIEFSTRSACITTLSSQALSVCKKALVGRPKSFSGKNPYQEESHNGVLDQF